MKVIRTDNYDRDDVDDALVAGPGLSKQEATRMVDELNDRESDPNTRWFWRAVEDDYPLKRWEP